MERVNQIMKMSVRNVAARITINVIMRMSLLALVISLLDIVPAIFQPVASLVEKIIVFGCSLNT
ncbi:hypothetical protein D3C74_399230 [compost metagenome]